MKTTNTPEQTATLAEALRNAMLSLFGDQSSDPKYNAQRNLQGRTHYVDDDTLRWHKSRVLHARSEANGTLFVLCTSDAKNMENTERGFRYLAFDVFGSCVYRPELQDATKTRDQARKAFDKAEIDVVAHYREALEGQRKQHEQQAQNLSTALAAIA